MTTKKCHLAKYFEKISIVLLTLFSFNIYLTENLIHCIYLNYPADTSVSTFAKRVMFWHRLCSASFSAWCLNRSQKTFTMTVLYTSAIVWMVVCLTSGDCMTIQNTWAAVPWPPLKWQCFPRCPHRKSPAAPQRFELEVNLQKTEVLHQPASLEEYGPPHITIDETELKAVH